MAKKDAPEVDQDDKPQAPQPKKLPTGLDEHAVNVFAAIGLKDVPENVVTIYREFKRRKDSIQPGRLSPEGFATVLVLADVIDKRIALEE